MSRAFVKEPDGDQVPDDRPRRVHSAHPNFITRAGLDALRARRDAEKDKAARAFLDDRLQKAIVVDPPAEGDVAAREEANFGARVRVADDGGHERAFTIVGEDEADPAAGRISWVAPLAAAVRGARVGDVVTWVRPDGPVDLEVLEVSY